MIHYPCHRPRPTSLIVTLNSSQHPPVRKSTYLPWPFCVSTWTTHWTRSCTPSSPTTSGAQWRRLALFPWCVGGAGVDELTPLDTAVVVSVTTTTFECVIGDLRELYNNSVSYKTYCVSVVNYFICILDF